METNVPGRVYQFKVDTHNEPETYFFHLVSASLTFGEYLQEPVVTEDYTLWLSNCGDEDFELIFGFEKTMNEKEVEERGILFYGIFIREGVHDIDSKVAETIGKKLIFYHWCS
jgi:hypothetical protein